MAGQPLSRRRQRRVAYGLLGAGTALVLRSWNLLPLEWSCPLRQLTGVPCPTCFLTRSVLTALRGDLAASLHWHPLGLPLLLAGAAVSLALLSGHLPRPAILGPVAGLAGLAAVGVWAVRLWGWQHGLPLPDTGSGP